MVNRPVGPTGRYVHPGARGDGTRGAHPFTLFTWVVGVNDLTGVNRIIGALGSRYCGQLEGFRLNLSYLTLQP